MIPTEVKKNAFKEVLMLIAIVSIFATQAMAQNENTSHEEHRAAFDSCLTELGIEKPEEGQRPQAPDDETREKIDACMKEKGFEPPKHRGGPREGGEGRRPPRFEGGAVQ